MFCIIKGINMEKLICLMAKIKDHNKRIDVVLSNNINKYSRSYIKKLINGDYVRVNHLLVKASHKVFEGDHIEMVIPSPVKVDIEPEDIPIDIVYEDEDLIIINKKQGMVVHPAPGNYTGTLVNALLYHCSSLSGINGVLRPGIVHRIDKDTSGLLMVAKNDYAHQSLAKQLKEHSVQRKYIALTEGVIHKEKGIINLPIGRHPTYRKKMAVVSKNSKPAVTYFKVLERFTKNTLIEAVLETGRTHQIRVHMEYIGYPLVGDSTYGYQIQKFNLNGQLLHAKYIGFMHPTKEIYMDFNIEPPKYFQQVINLLNPL